MYLVADGPERWLKGFPYGLAMLPEHGLATFKFRAIQYQTPEPFGTAQPFPARMFPQSMLYVASPYPNGALPLGCHGLTDFRSKVLSIYLKSGNGDP
jgi:hypothetical protein